MVILNLDEQLTVVIIAFVAIPLAVWLHRIGTKINELCIKVDMYNKDSEHHNIKSDMESDKLDKLSELVALHGLAINRMQDDIKDLKNYDTHKKSPI